MVSCNSRRLQRIPKRLLWALIPLGLDLNEKFSDCRRGTSLLEDTDADGKGRGGCTGGEAEARDVGFEKYSSSCLPFDGQIEK